jgi:NADH oxidase (H2O2-forming)
VPQKILVIGGGAAGIGAAGGIKAADAANQAIVYTEYEDVGYSPCGIPYVHGKEIDTFERLFLAQKEAYVQAGIEIHYQTKVDAIDLDRKVIRVAGEGEVSWDRLVIATGFDYADPGVAGGELDGLYYVKNIRQAMTWDRVLDEVKSAVVVHATPLGVEMTTALAQRGIQTHLIDPQPWAMAELVDPDIIAPVQESWQQDLGVDLRFNATLRAFQGEGKLSSVSTSAGDIPADIAVVCTHKQPNNTVAVEAGLKPGPTGGLIVDERMATPERDVYAAGDCVELPHGVTRVGVQGLTGSHAYAQGKVAGFNAGGGSKRYQPVYVPWGTPAGKWVIGGASFGETTASALGIPYVVAQAEGISRARYYPGVKKMQIKLLAEPDQLRLIGAQMIGQEGIKERADFLATAIKFGLTLHDLAAMENVYSPAIGALNEPIVLAAQNGLDTIAAQKV